MFFQQTNLIEFILYLLNSMKCSIHSAGVTVNYFAWSGLDGPKIVYDCRYLEIGEWKLTWSLQCFLAGKFGDFKRLRDENVVEQ